jgi:hypothetical protein
MPGIGPWPAGGSPCTRETLNMSYSRRRDWSSGRAGGDFNRLGMAARDAPRPAILAFNYVAIAVPS